MLRVAAERLIDPVEVRARYALAAPMRDGMLDIDHGAPVSAPWDLGIVAGIPTVVWKEAP